MAGESYDWWIPSAQRRAERHLEMEEAAKALLHKHHAAEGAAPYDWEIAGDFVEKKQSLLDRISFLGHKSVAKQVKLNV
jgi:hypothetical protein